MQLIPDWLYPQTVEIVHSKFNGDIKVVCSRGRYSVWVGGFEQSGVMVEALWKKGLKEAEKYFVSPPKKVLILGFGCGSAAKLISQKWPKAKITGIEIDPVMIKLGKKYFDLGANSGLQIFEAAASKCIKLLAQQHKKFDLILVDIYSGGQLGEKIVSNSSLGNLKKICTRNRRLIFNQSSFKESKGTLEAFQRKISANFAIKQIIKTEYNLLMVC